ncbi:hypothetical protein ACFVVM_06370 [Nocardia sp. NPDC058176]|uniref:hypothetical protein n=1 Tax=Nocardia sp. NPDC058176 TaxID=3346368 RepID=UPI0036DC1940
MNDLLDRTLSLRQLLHLAVTTTALLGVPYLVVGILWLLGHREHLADQHGIDKVFSMIGEVVAWPLLLFADISLR